jgi:hypothetical protein
MGIFPIVGLTLVKKWVTEDLKRAESVQKKRAQIMDKMSNARN